MLTSPTTPAVRRVRLPERTRLLIALLLFIVFAAAACSSSNTNTVQQVDEDFPTAQPTEPAPPEDDAAADEPTEPTEAPVALDESETITEGDTLTESETLTETADTSEAPEPEPTPAAPEPTATPAEPVALKSGTFTFIDNLHNATGTATVYQLPDGSRVLRFEEFEVSEGPGIYVLLANHPQPRNDGELFDQGQVELGELTALSGNQNYPIPAELDLAEFNAVVLYCRPYTTIMSTAELAEPAP
jgi:hypothetical protein